LESYDWKKSKVTTVALRSLKIKVMFQQLVPGFCHAQAMHESSFHMSSFMHLLLCVS